MQGERHDLLHELHEHKEAIHDLKVSNTDFATLFEEFHNLDHEIQGLESENQPVSDTFAEDLKKRRLKLMDDMVVMITAYEKEKLAAAG